MRQLMTVTECSSRLGVSEQCLREMIKAGKTPFAVAINPTGRKWTYKIFTARFEQWLKGTLA